MYVQSCKAQLLALLWCPLPKLLVSAQESGYSLNEAVASGKWWKLVHGLHDLYGSSTKEVLNSAFGKRGSVFFFYGVYFLMVAVCEILQKVSGPALFLSPPFTCMSMAAVVQSFTSEMWSYKQGSSQVLFSSKVCSLFCFTNTAVGQSTLAQTWNLWLGNMREGRSNSSGSHQHKQGVILVTGVWRLPSA